MPESQRKIKKHLRETRKLTKNKNNKNYLAVGKPHRLKSDERKEERKRGTKYERKSLKSGKEERIGTEKPDERKRGMQKKNRKERAAGEEKIELHLYYVIGRAGRRSRRTSAGRRRL